MLRPLAVIMLLAAVPALAVPPKTAPAAPPAATGASIHLNPVPGRPAAGYVSITGGARPDRLVGVSAPGARIEMHSMTMAGGIMKMAKLASLDVPAGGKAVFAPGGNHLMIFGLTGTPASLPITLAFASGAKVTATAIVKTIGAEDHAGH